jgi:hypothetical protein
VCGVPSSVVFFFTLFQVLMADAEAAKLNDYFASRAPKAKAPAKETKSAASVPPALVPTTNSNNGGVLNLAQEKEKERAAAAIPQTSTWGAASSSAPKSKKMSDFPELGAEKPQQQQQKGKGKTAEKAVDSNPYAALKKK